MSWNYLPLTEEEAQKSRYDLLDDGFYDARIERCEIKTSSNGNQMFVVETIVFDKTGEGRHLKDYCVNTKQMMWKQRHLAVSAGLEKEFMAQEFHPGLLPGRMVKVQIGLQLGSRIPDDKLNGKAPGSMYPDKNVILDYVKDDALPLVNSTAVKANEPFFDDSIPF